MIGVSAYRDRARWDIWDETAVLAPQTYLNALQAAGAVPVLLPPVPAIETTVELLDGLVLSAGPDVDPTHYGERPQPECELRPGRDEPELALLAAARAADLPVLGICRGMQLMAISYGGSLIQHLPEDFGVGHHGRAPGAVGHHPIALLPGHRVAAALGPRGAVSTHHHQGVRDPGGLTVTARADDGLIEAVEDPALAFMVGVQWHPEIEHPELFRALVDACGAAAGARSVSGDG